LIPVLLYHAVAERARSGMERWTVSPETFAEHLDVLATSRRTSITMTALAEGLRGRHPLPSTVLAITFDDGYADTWDAILALRRRGLRSSVFITSGEIGQAGRLTCDQVRALAELPEVEVGAHSVTHRRLDELGDAEIAAEVRGSRSQLQAVIGGQITAFAYPHGSYDRRARQAVIDAGFVAAAAVKNAASHAGDDPYAVARWTVTRATTAERVQALLDGRGVALAISRERARTRAFRLVRRARRRGIETFGGSP
jgi:peptidoglycan/xylan/chitin deacetylase (PgdA/CDA1 family)